MKKAVPFLAAFSVLTLLLLLNFVSFSHLPRLDWAARARVDSMCGAGKHIQCICPGVNMPEEMYARYYPWCVSSDELKSLSPQAAQGFPLRFNAYFEGIITQALVIDLTVAGLVSLMTYATLAKLCTARA